MKVDLNPDLETYRREMLAKVDREAEAFRNQFITPGSGQAMVYMVKEAEARAYTADPAAPAPHIAAEATARGTTPAETAQLVIDTADDWRQLSAAIEGQRQASKVAITDAETIADIRAASEPDWDALLE